LLEFYAQVAHPGRPLADELNIARRKSFRFAFDDPRELGKTYPITPLRKETPIHIVSSDDQLVSRRCRCQASWGAAGPARRPKTHATPFELEATLSRKAVRLVWLAFLTTD
jgi:hypothetical protein